MLNLDNGDLVPFTTAKWLDCGNLLRVTELLLQIKALIFFFKLKDLENKGFIISL